MEQCGLCTIGLQKIKRMIWSFIGNNAIKQSGISLPFSGFFQDLFVQNAQSPSTQTVLDPNRAIQNARLELDPN